MDEVPILIATLYSPTSSPETTHQIQLRLQQVQQSEQAWSFIEPLLNSPDTNQRFFAASTLTSKISNQWDTLPKDHHDPLKLSVLNWLSRSAIQAYAAQSAGERPVLRKLATAVALLSMRIFEQWSDWLLDVILRVVGAGASREAVMTILSECVETFARADLVGSRRVAYLGTLTSATPHLVTSLVQSLSSDNIPEINEALSCFTCMLQSGLIHHQELSTLYPNLLPHLSNPALVTRACSAVEEIIDRSTSAGGTGLTKFMTRMRTNEIVSGWVTSPWVAQVIQEAFAEEDAGDEAVAVMRLICSISEVYISYLFEPRPPSAPPTLTFTSPETSTFFHLLVAVTTFPGHNSESYNINEMTNGAWMALQEESSDVGLVFGSGPGREGRSEGREAEWPVIQHTFSALAEGLRQRATRPLSSETSSWPKDIHDAFRVYRSTVISETILYAYYALRESLLANLVELAQRQLSQQGELNDLEATLFCLYSIRDGVLDDENVHLPRLFSSSILGRLPSEGFTQLRSSALYLVGQYSTWFSAHPEEGLQAVSFVVPALSTPELAPQAARALRLLCTSNRKALGQHVGSFISVLGGLEGKVEEDELIKVLESVASVIQGLPPDQFVEPLLTLTVSVIARLQDAINLNAQNPTDSRTSSLQQLAYLTACARGLADPEDELVFDADTSLDEPSAQRVLTSAALADARVVDMRSRLAVAVEGAANLWASDVEVAQALQEFITASSSDVNPSPLGLDALILLSLAVKSLQSSLSPVWLALATSLVERLSRSRSDSQMTDQEVALVGAPIEAALSAMLSTYSDLSAMDEHPDVVTAFLGFCHAIVRHFPRVLAALPNHLDAILRFGERGLGMQERFSIKATIDLLVISVQQTRMASPSAKTFGEVLVPHLRTLLGSVLTAIAGAVPRSQLASLSELLFACVLRFPDDTRAHFHDLMSTPSWPTEKCTSEVKLKFEKTILGARSGKIVRSAVSDFASVARGLDGTAYGAQSISIFD
ncbi:ARM repeat-containing protein [Meredithblackwellia eburnea MCA 4105]